ncbi:MAG: chloride channel protein [Gammaproteobacteria bacterium]
MQSQVKDTGAELVVDFVIGGLVGVIVATASKAFVSGVSFFTALRENQTLIEIAIFGTRIELTSLVFLWSAAGLLILMRRIFKITRWHGPADSIYHAHQSKEPLDEKHGLVSTLAAFTSAAGGGSVGQYGPLVHFGATIGVIFKRFFKSRLSNEIYLGCGVAAAISAGFGAPIAGIVFAHEAVLRHLSVRAMAPISIASVTAAAFSQAFFKNTTPYAISAQSPDLAALIPILIIAAPVVAVTAITFMQGLRYSARFARESGWSAERLIITAATVCGTVGIWVPEILGVGLGTVNEMLGGQYQIPMLLLLLVLKISMTAICIGFGLFGGVFSPALFIGVAVGGLVSQISIAAGGPSLTEAISIAAMASVAATVIGAPITAILIVLELTQSYAYAVAALMAVMTSMLLTHRLFGHSFFDRQLIDRGVDLALGREGIALTQHTLEDHIGDDCVVLTGSSTGQEALTEMRTREQTEAYVISDLGKLVGKLSIHQAIEAGDQLAEQHCDEDPLILRSDDSLQHAMYVVSDFVGESIPIVGEDREFLGAITEGDLFTAVIEVQSKVRNEERG